MPKAITRSVGLFFLVDPSELADFDEWVEWLLSLRSGLCDVVERDGELVLLEVRRRVATVDHRMSVEVYSAEHPPPHFHVKSTNIDASFAIHDCSLLRGTVCSGDLRRIRYWHQRAKPKLVEVWNSTRPGDCTVGEYDHA